MGNRTKKSILNAEVNLLFYFLTLFLTFFSRKIFLDNLGAEFIGLTGTLGNFLGYLNLAELGIGSCISFFLFQPLQSNDREKVGEILSVFGYLYRLIGCFILLCAIILSLFFPLIFNGSELCLGIIYFAFYSFLGSSLIGYFINYRQILLGADQKNYLVAIYYQSGGLVKTALQIFLAYRYKNLYVWVFVEFLFGIFSCIILNRKINREYPWLKTDKSRGRELLRKYPTILTNTRQIFIHKIKDFILNKSDELFIFAFVSLKMVAYYGNYTLIVAKAGQMFSAVLDSTYAGVGNLIAEGSRPNTMKVFWELMTIRHFVAGFLFFTIFNLIESFISVWLGPEYVLSRTILLLLCIHVYISTSRGVVDMFNHAHGLYADTWSAWTELLLNVGITLVAGYYWGIIGILMGKICSTLVIIVFWKPYYLFSSGFHERYLTYWKGAFRNYFASFASIAVSGYLLSLISLQPADTLGAWLLYSIAAVVIFLAVNISLTMILCRGTRDIIQRIRAIIRHK